MPAPHRLQLAGSFGLAVALSAGSIRGVEPGPLKPLADVPAMESGAPGPGRRVRVTEPEYAGTGVHHSLYLPPDYDPSRRYPVIVEYTGNYFPASGSTGEVSGAHLGYAATLGRGFLWVVLPFVSEDKKQNAVTWWGDEDATVAYAKMVVPRILENYHGDPDRVVLCGFSRGAIAVSYIGLHDDAIAKLWSAFFTHDHFDGQKEWKNQPWGSPLAQYRNAAAERLRRLNGRPFWVGQNGGTKGIEAFLAEEGLLGAGRFQFESIPIAEMFPLIPNAHVPHPHTDLWPLFPSEPSGRLRVWLHQSLHLP